MLPKYSKDFINFNWVGAEKNTLIQVLHTSSSLLASEWHRHTRIPYKSIFHDQISFKHYDKFCISESTHPGPNGAHFNWLWTITINVSKCSALAAVDTTALRLSLCHLRSTSSVIGHNIDQSDPLEGLTAQSFKIKVGY